MMFGCILKVIDKLHLLLEIVSKSKRRLKGTMSRFKINTINAADLLSTIPLWN